MSSNTQIPHSCVSRSYHSRDLKRGTLLSIIEQSGMTTEQFLEFL